MKAKYNLDRNGYYGRFGGSFIPEVLHTTVQELIKSFESAKADPEFWKTYVDLMAEYSGRPTPVTHLANLSRDLGGAQIYVKREDLNHTGAHKANNVLGQGLLVQRMGKNRVIAETGAGQHGVATATMAAKFGFDCTIYMGATDIERQRPNVFWMEKMGAEVVSVKAGQNTLKDAINECTRDWVSSMESTHYVFGTACGTHPFPEMVAWFQSIIGIEAREQILARAGKLPDRVYACVGGGSNAMGIFQGFIEDEDVELIGVEAGGKGMSPGMHASRLAPGSNATPGVNSFKSVFLQDGDGQMQHTISCAAGLDYVGVSPILAWLKDEGRVRFEAALDVEVVETLKKVMRFEGIIPALESTHAFVQALKEAPQMRPDQVILINQSGRGDKDIFTVADAIGDPKWFQFLKERVANA